MKKIIPVALFIMLYGFCFADQAAWISKEHADAAVKILSKAGTVRHYCEPCGDEGYRSEKVAKARSGWVDYNDADYYEVLINETSVDLAYVYILQQGRWTNLAMILRIEVSGVSKIMPASVREIVPDDIHKSNMKDFEMEE